MRREGQILKAENKNGIQKIHPIESGTEGLTVEDLKILKAHFPKDKLGVKVQSFNKERSRAMLVLYLQHTEVQERLEQVDPGWSMEVLQEEQSNDTFYVRMRMTVKGVKRENIGDGNDPKAAYSDALKRCAMLFGVGRYLYDTSGAWVDYQDNRDRFRAWTYEDYESARNSSRSEGPTAPASGAAKKVKAFRTRDQLYRTLMNLYRPYLSRYADTQFAELLNQRYQVGETRLMSEEQLEDLVRFMEDRLKVAI